MSKPCIFCGSRGNKSKEHIWPVWMHAHLPLLGGRKNTRELQTFKWKEQIGCKSLSRQGHLSTTKFRVVCKSCNSGWMNILEGKAKSILTRILRRDGVKLSVADQEILARWIAMKAMTGEHAENEVHMTPKADRHLLRLEGKIPDYYAIYIGAHNTDSDTAWLRVSQTIALSQEGPSPPLGNLKRNIQSIAFICGPLFVFVFGVRERGIDAAKFFHFRKLQRIFPAQSALVEWSLKEILSRAEMGQVAWALDELKNHKNVKYAGDLP